MNFQVACEIVGLVVTEHNSIKSEVSALRQQCNNKHLHTPVRSTRERMAACYKRVALDDAPEILQELPDVREKLETFTPNDALCFIEDFEEGTSQGTLYLEKAFKITGIPPFIYAHLFALKSKLERVRWSDMCIWDSNGLISVDIITGNVQNTGRTFSGRTNVFEALLKYGHDEDFEPTASDDFEATHAPAGSDAKIEMMRRRVEEGNPLHHKKDRDDFDGLRGAIRPRE